MLQVQVLAKVGWAPRSGDSTSVGRPILTARLAADKASFCGKFDLSAGRQVVGVIGGPLEHGEFDNAFARARGESVANVDGMCRRKNAPIESGLRHQIMCLTEILGRL